MISWRSHPPLAAASVLGATALALFAWTLVRALTVSTDAPPLAPAGNVSLPEMTVTQRAAGAPVGEVVNVDPFRANRRRPPLRYAPPGAVRLAPAAAPATSVALAGTVVYPDGGGLALVRVGGRAGAVMVRVGETVEGLTLKSVAREEAVFASRDGRTVVLRVPKAGS